LPLATKMTHAEHRPFQLSKHMDVSTQISYSFPTNRKNISLMV
jgi:hypothetical protein